MVVKFLFSPYGPLGGFAARRALALRGLFLLCITYFKNKLDVLHCINYTKGVDSKRRNKRKEDIKMFQVASIATQVNYSALFLNVFGFWLEISGSWESEEAFTRVAMFSPVGGYVFGSVLSAEYGFVGVER